jgi:hypothetical protein
LSVEKIPLREAMEMDFSAILPDAKSLAAFYLARPFLMKYMQHSS